MSTKISKKLGEILIEDGLLQPPQLAEALAVQKERGGLIGQILVELDFIQEDSLVSALGKQFRIPYLPLKHYAVNPDMGELLKSEFCHKHLLAPFDSDAQKVFIAVSAPPDDELLEEVKALTQRKPKVFLSRISEIRDALYFLFHEGD